MRSQNGIICKGSGAQSTQNINRAIGRKIRRSYFTEQGQEPEHQLHRQHPWQHHR